MGFLDDIMDGAEAVVGGIEKALGRPESLWEVVTVVDAEDGSTTYQVAMHDPPNPSPHLETRDQKLAERVCLLLNNEGSR